MFQQTSEGVIFSVKVTPKAKCNQIIGWRENILCIRIAAVPDKGKANEELERFVASCLGIGRSQVNVIKGHTSRSKLLLISGIDLNQLEEKLS